MSRRALKGKAEAAASHIGIRSRKAAKARRDAKTQQRRTVRRAAKRDPENAPQRRRESLKGYWD